IGVKPVLAQNETKSSLNSYEYIFPMPGSKYNSVNTNIIIRLGEQFNLPDENKKFLSITGDKNGIYTGRIVQAENGRTLLFYPDKEFQRGELITVELFGDVYSVIGKPFPKFSYQFQTSNSSVDKSRIDKIIFNEFVKQNSYNTQSQPTTKKKKKSTLPNSINLPADFPPLSIDVVNEPSSGNVFFAPFIIPAGGTSSLEELIPTYLIITDNYGVPLFYRKTNS